MLILRGSLWDSNLFASVTLFPKRQYLAIFVPTTPANTGPVWIPILICNVENNAKLLVSKFWKSNKINSAESVMNGKTYTTL